MPIPRDPLRAQIMKSFPSAPQGMKKQYDPSNHTVRYVPKTPAELLRDGVRRGR